MWRRYQKEWKLRTGTILEVRNDFHFYLLAPSVFFCYIHNNFTNRLIKSSNLAKQLSSCHQDLQNENARNVDIDFVLKSFANNDGKNNFNKEIKTNI